MVGPCTYIPHKKAIPRLRVQGPRSQRPANRAFRRLRNGNAGPGREAATTALPRIRRGLTVRGKKAPAHALQIPERPTLTVPETERPDLRLHLPRPTGASAREGGRLGLTHYNSRRALRLRRPRWGAGRCSDDYTSQEPPRRRRAWCEAFSSKTTNPRMTRGGTYGA